MSVYKDRMPADGTHLVGAFGGKANLSQRLPVPRC
jgi:hypothetical protein